MDQGNTTVCCCLTSMGTETCQQHTFHRRRKSKSVDVNLKDKRRQEDIVGSFRKVYLNDERVTGESCETSDHKDQFYSDCDSTLNKIIRMNSDDSLNQETSCCDKMEFSGRSKDSGKNRDQFQFDISQQGPDLQQDSPRSTRSSPKINTGSGNVSMNNSPALQHKNLPVTESSSPSPPPPLNNVPSSFQQNQVQQQTLFSPSPQLQNFQQTSYGVTGATQSSVSSTQYPSPAMIFGPNANPSGYYYGSYPQMPPVRPMVPYEPHNVQQQQQVYYQPFMNTMMPPGGLYYAPPNMTPYMVNAQAMPWIQAHTDFTQMNYPPNANIAYSSHHPSMPHQQHYVQSYPNQRAHFEPSFNPEHVQYREESTTISAPSTPREESEHQPNVVLRRTSLKTEKQTLSAADKSDYIHESPPVHKFNEHNFTNDRDKMSHDIEKLSNVRDFNEQNSSSTMEVIASTNVSDSPKLGTNRYHTGAKLELEHGRTPLFGQCPTWWGENERENEDDECLSLNVQSEYQRKSSPQFQRKSESASDTEGRTKKYEPANKHSIRENIRMDIPFSSVEPPEQQDHIEKNKSRASNAMSFTIEFTPSEGARKRRSLSKPVVESKAEDQWKMQSAERVHNNFIRRSLRKAGGITPETHPLTSAINAKHVENKEQELRATAKDPKAYLLNKMLTSETEEPVKLPKESQKPSNNIPSNIEIRPRRNSDAGSDAGTYVVDRDQEQEEEIRARLQIDQVFGVGSRSRSSSSSLERTPSPLSYEEAVIIPRKPIVPAKPFVAASKALPTSSPRAAGQCAVSQSLIDKEEEKKKKGLLKQLLKISQQPDHRRSLPASTTVSKPDPAPPARRSILKKNNSTAGTNYGVGSSSNTSSTNAGSFSRAEQGRLSLRSTSCNSSAPAKSLNTASKPKASSSVKSAKDNEMSLWLRRKEYNPMKAAAEAKSKKIQPQSSTVDPPYLSNRSQSFHTGAILPKGSLRKHQSIEDSLADSDIDPLNESSSVANYSRNFAASLNRLSRGVESDNDIISRRSKALDSDSIILARLSKELGSHAKDVLSKLHASNSGSNVSKSVDNVFNCADDPSEEDSLEHSNAAGITGLVRQLELANQAFEVVGTFLKNQTDKNSSGEPADPASASLPEKNFRIRRTHLTKLGTKLNDSQTRNLSDNDTF